MVLLISWCSILELLEQLRLNKTQFHVTSIRDAKATAFPTDLALFDKSSIVGAVYDEIYLLIINKANNDGSSILDRLQIEFSQGLQCIIKPTKKQPR